MWRMCYNPPLFGRRTSPQARRSGRNRRAINSGMEKNSVLRRLLVCALSALLIAAAAVPLAAAPAAAVQEKKEQKAEEKPKKEVPPPPAKVDKDNPTAEQVAETVVLFYGSRPRLAQI